MISLIQFEVKRKLWKKTMVWKYILLFIILGLIVHADVFLNYLQANQKVSVSLDTSVEDYSTYFEDSDIVCFEEGSSNRLVFEDDWKLYVAEEVDETVIEEIHKNIQRIPGFSYYDRNYELIIHHSIIKDRSLELVMYTILYFLFLSKSVAITQDVIEDKLNGMNDMLLSSISARKHLLAKISIGWICILIETVLSFGCMILWFIMRFGFHIEKIYQWIQQWLIMDAVQFHTELVIIGIVAMVLGMFLLQMLILTYMSQAKSIEEANQMTLWVHLVPVILYYVCFSMFSMNFMQIEIGKSMLLVPLLQTLLLPLSLSYERKITIIFILGVVSSVVYIILFLYFGITVYRKRVLNIEKSYEPI